MTLNVVKGNEQGIDYGVLRALVVDDYPGMRSALKMTLSNFGMTRIELAASASEVIFKVGNTHYDVILCDFNLGEGRDGQQLLEELRHRGLIHLDTVFIMVTAESVYEKVVATAELAPDDYLIKPFSAEVLRNRLDGILLRKRAFSSVYRHYEANELEAAMTACDELIRDHPRYVVDALRFKGEVLNALGRFQEAETLYRQVVGMRAIPWARLGLAKALHAQKKEDEAEELLHDVLEKTPELVAAYDLLADVRIARKDGAGAQEALSLGVAISAKTVRRQQKLGGVALENGDLAAARDAYAAVLEKGRHSVYVSPSDFGNLCRVQLEQGDVDAALDTLKKNRTILQASPQGQLVAAVMQGLAHTRAGRAEEAARALDEAIRLRGSGARVDEHAMLDMAGTCLSQGRNEEADAIVSEVARNSHDSDSLLAKARRLYEESGRGEDGARVLAAATADVRKLNNEGVILAHKGDFQGAVERLLVACREAPFNPRILMNGIWVILKCLEQSGMDNDLLDEARRLLAEVERQAPGHARIAGLRHQMKEVENRFGIRPRSAR
ncbi:MAG: response regulator [Thiobacillaceae bacterium]|jgi:DNA-binding response OmpR family regulator/Flp pilus assembly protein TadD|nr:response regulator [Thiobacillaceae bacterium]